MLVTEPFMMICVSLKTVKLQKYQTQQQAILYLYTQSCINIVACI